MVGKIRKNEENMEKSDEENMMILDMEEIG